LTLDGTRKTAVAHQPLRPTILITCEHGGHKVPLAWRHLFASRQETLQSHRGWDPGALALARQFAARMEATLFSSLVTRLLVELNRSLHHPGLFS
jgi:predicted N-formylglutamate amidohydrolase